MRHIAVIDNLVQLLTRPRRGRFRAQIIQHQQGRGTDFFETLIKRGARVRAKSRTQMIEQVWHNYKHRRITALGLIVRNRRGQVRLARAIAARKHQPVLRLLGKVFGQAQRVFQIRVLVARKFGAGAERLKGAIVIQRQAAHEALPLLDGATAKIGRSHRQFAHEIEIRQT